MCDIIKDIDFYGIKLSIIEKNVLLNHICNVVDKNEKIVIYGYSLGSFRILKKFPIMYSFAWDKADVMLVDGRGLFVIGKLLGFPFKDDLSIPKLSQEILRMANDMRYSILFLGTTADVNARATYNTRIKYKNIKVFDGIDGFFNIEDEEAIVKHINSIKPSILFIGISSPKKEEFVSRWKDSLNVNIILLCGGVIDIIAGDKRQTPNWLKKIGGASFYRFIQEPVRLSRYFFPFIIFMLFNFLPVLVFKVLILRDKNFSIPNHYNLKR